MRGCWTLIAKDWKLIRRNRLLLAVLVLYPFLIMGVIGAAFQESGRPVPLGLVNLDRRDGAQVLWWSLSADPPSGLERSVRWEAEESAPLSSADLALEGLLQGIWNVVTAEVEEGADPRWWGHRVDPGVLDRLMDRLEASAEAVRYRDSLQEALEEMGGGRGLLVGVLSAACAFLGESIWVEGTPYDSGGLVREFSHGVLELREFPDRGRAMEELRKGRVDAVLLLPPGFVRRLRTLEKVAELEVILDQSSLVKAEFAETALRGFLSRVSERVVGEKMQAVVAGLRVLVEGGDFFGTQVTGLVRIRDDLVRVRDRLGDNPELRERVEEGIGLADTVIADIEEAADYLRGTALPVELRISSVAGRPLAARDAVVPSLIALSMLWTGVLCGAILMVLEDEEGMRVRLRLTETGPLALVGSKLLLAAGIVFAQCTVMLILAVAVFRAFASNLFLALVTMALSTLSCIGMGLVLAAFARQVAGAVILGLLVSFPLIFLTGMIFPLNLMPAVMRGLARAIPLTYTVEALSGVMLRGEGAAGVLGEWLALLGFGSFFLFLGSLLVRRRPG